MTDFVLSEKAKRIFRGLKNPFVVDEEVESFKSDPIKFIECEKYLYIKTKKGDLILFVLNRMQKRFIERIRARQAEGKPIRFRVLKARQHGISTLIAAIIYVRGLFRENVNSVIIADDLDGSNYLFDMAKLYHEKNTRCSYTLQRSNEKKIEFAGRHSQIMVDTADNLDAGRKYTFQDAHLSEAAFFRDLKTLQKGLFQSVPDHPNTMIFIETTANGASGDFYDDWQSGKPENKKPMDEWENIFFAWFENPDYYMQPPEGFKVGIGQLMDDNEIEIQTMYNLSDGQMYWRRWCIINKCKSDIETFKQEYPSNDLEAFRTTGHCYFNRNALNRMQAKHMIAGRKGFLEWVGPGKLIFKEDPDGWFEFFKLPEKGHRYCIGDDVAEGKEVIEGKERDMNAADVVEIKTLEQVAQMIHRLEPKVHKEELKKLALFYNKAYTGTENNKDWGLSKAFAEEYSNTFYQEDFEPNTQTRTRTPGWNTNKKTKPIMITHLNDLLRENLCIIHSSTSYSQMSTFIRNADGTCSAQSGAFDDDVMALCIAYQMCLCVPTDLGQENEEQAEEQSWENSQEYQNQLRNKQLAGAGYFGR